MHNIVVLRLSYFLQQLCTYVTYHEYFIHTSKLLVIPPFLTLRVFWQTHLQTILEGFIKNYLKYMKKKMLTKTRKMLYFFMHHNNPNPDCQRDNIFKGCVRKSILIRLYICITSLLKVVKFKSNKIPSIDLKLTTLTHLFVKSWFLLSHATEIQKMG